MKFLLGIILAVSVGFGVFIMAKKNSEVDAKPVFRKDSIPPAVDKNIVAYPDPNPFVQGALKEFEGFIKTVLANRQAPGAAVAIVRDTSIILLKGYGLRNTKKTDSINTHTIFRLGSVSKSVTATLVAILVNEGVLHWDDAARAEHRCPRAPIEVGEAKHRLGRTREGGVEVGALDRVGENEGTAGGAGGRGPPPGHARSRQRGSGERARAPLTGASLGGIVREAATASVSAAAITASDTQVGISTAPLETSLRPTKARMAASPARRNRKRSTMPESRK